MSLPDIAAAGLLICAVCGVSVLLGGIVAYFMPKTPDEYPRDSVVEDIAAAEQRRRELRAVAAFEGSNRRTAQTVRIVVPISEGRRKGVIH